MPHLDLPWKGHAGFGVIAFDSLPAWQRELVRPDMSPAALDKPYLPTELIRSPREKMGYLCTIMDLVYYDELRPYVTLPDGRWIPHGQPDQQRQCTAGSGQIACPLTSSSITASLLERTIDAIATNDWEEVIRHAGTLGHYLQEPFTPGHAVDNHLFHQLFPDPDGSRHMRLHHAFDSGTNDFEPLPPTLMGQSIDEAAYRIQLEVDRGVREGMRLIGPVIESVYRGEGRHVREALLARQSQKATWITASAWHTAFSIAKRRFEPGEVEALASVDLTQVTPYFWHQCQYVDLLPGSLVQNKRLTPIHVWREDGRGRRLEQHVERGFGMGGHMGCKFFINGDVYPVFRCRVGLPSRHLEGQGDHTDVRFIVAADPGINRTYSEEMDYRVDPLATVELHPGAAVQEVEVDVRGARSLLLVTQSKPYTDTVTGRTAFMIPHVAVCEPRLERAPVEGR